MPALLSNEGRIETMLREIHCSGRSFVEVAKALNPQVSHEKFSEALNGMSRFDDVTGARLLALLDELKAVRDYFPDVPINWSDSERVSRLVVLRRVERVAGELDREKDSI